MSIAPRTALVFAPCALVLVLAPACRGSLVIFGPLWPADDDDSAGDDDTPGDDDSADDDDATPGDDDDATGTGLPVSCGPAVSPGDEWAGQAVAAITGDARVTIEHDARGGFFDARWEGCEARHYFDAEGVYACGVRWALAGDSYGEQYQAGRLVTRFSIAATRTENTCAPDQPGIDRAPFYFRLTVPTGEGVLDLRWSAQEDTNPNAMLPWASVPYDGEGDERPTEVELAYAQPFEPGVGAP